jgi:hypothetical protein
MNTILSNIFKLKTLGKVYIYVMQIMAIGHLSISLNNTPFCSIHLNKKSVCSKYKHNEARIAIAMQRL